MGGGRSGGEGGKRRREGEKKTRGEIRGRKEGGNKG